MVVQEAWAKGSFGDVLNKIQACIDDLDQWGRNIKNRFMRDIRRCKQDILLLLFNHDHESEALLKATKAKLGGLLLQEESFWRQRAKTHRLQEGDSNTKFFHAMATNRKRRNVIKQLDNGVGNVIVDQGGMCNVAKEYFQNLFFGGSCSYNLVLDVVNPRVSMEDNNRLTQPFTMEEFRLALFQMHPDKSPDPDGLNAAFYQRFWNLCGDDIFFSLYILAI